MQESELIRRAQDGDRDAMEELLNTWYTPIFAYVYKNTGRYHLAKDLTQEALIKTVLALNRYRPRAPFKSWLFAIVSNHLKNYYRTLSRHPDPDPLDEDAPAANTAFARSEQRGDIGAALARLPPEQREALVLRFYHGFSMREIAAVTGARETTVKARVRYGLEKMKQELEGYDVNEP